MKKFTVLFATIFIAIVSLNAQNLHEGVNFRKIKNAAYTEFIQVDAPVKNAVYVNRTLNDIEKRSIKSTVRRFNKMHKTNIVAHVILIKDFKETIVTVDNSYENTHLLMFIESAINDNNSYIISYKELFSEIVMCGMQQ